jgi:outer membrane immunogenic protein
LGATVFQKLLSTSVLIVAATTCASAADLPSIKGAPMYVPPVFSWTGFYLGANVGGDFLSSNLGTTVPATSNIIPPATALATGLGNAGAEGRGVAIGGQIGYNYQIGHIVVGLEGDADYLTNRLHRDTGPTSFNAGLNTGEVVDNIRNDLLVTARGRFGWAADRLLIYATGGWAGTHQSFARNQYWSFADGCPAGINGLENCHDGAISGFKSGFVVGAGFEYAITNNLSVKGEFLHAEFPGSSVISQNNGAFIPSGIQPIVFSEKTSMNIARVGLNYHFDFLAPPAPVVAKY